MSRPTLFCEVGDFGPACLDQDVNVMKVFLTWRWGRDGRVIFGERLPSKKWSPSKNPTARDTLQDERTLHYDIPGQQDTCVDTGDDSMSDTITSDGPSADQLAALATAMPSFTVTDQVPSTTAHRPDGDEDEDGDGEEFEYKLFAAPQRVSLLTPRDPTYACPVRPTSHYRHLPTPAHLCAVALSAITGAQVLRQAATETRQAGRGDRVLHVPFIHHVPQDPARPRWRPSKARRTRFKQLREQERKRLEIRASVRARAGRGRGGGGTSGRGKASGSAGTRPGKEKSASGYPRKGPPPA